MGRQPPDMSLIDAVCNRGMDRRMPLYSARAWESGLGRSRPFPFQAEIRPCSMPRPPIACKISHGGNTVRISCLRRLHFLPPCPAQHVRTIQTLTSCKFLQIDYPIGISQAHRLLRKRPSSTRHRSRLPKLKRPRTLQMLGVRLKSASIPPLRLQLSTSSP
jgi:hypothetical protein